MSNPHQHDRRRGLDRLRSANRWVVVGAIGLTGAFSWIAAKAFPGKAATAQTPQTAQTPTNDNSSVQGGDDQPLTQPQQAPVVPQQQYQPPVVSGGS